MSFEQKEVVIDKVLGKKIKKIVKRNFSKEKDFLGQILEKNSVNNAEETKTNDKVDIELDVAKLIRKELKSAGIKSEFVGASKKRSNVVGVVGPSRSRKNLIFNAHMDTAESIGSFRGDPLSPFIRGKKMYGLGVLRAKAMIAAFVYAADTLNQLDLPLSGKLVLQFVVDGMSGPDTRLGTKYLLSKGVKAKAAVLGFPGDVVGIGHRGGYRFKMTTKGEEVRTASAEWQTKDRGLNAITEMMKAVEVMVDWELPFKPAKAFPDKKPVFTFPTMIDGGVAANMVPDTCVAVGDVRLMPGNSDKQVRIRIEEKLKSLKGLKYKLEDMLYVPAVEVDRKEEIVQVVADEVGVVTRKEARVEGIGEWNTGWMFAKKDIPAVMQLPLEGGSYKGNHDWVHLSSLMDLTEAMVRTAVSFLGVKQIS